MTVNSSSEAHEGPNLRQIAWQTGEEDCTRGYPDRQTHKPTGNLRRFVRCLFACIKSIGPPLQTSQKCKLLLHLGNSLAFSVDNKLSLTYDFIYLHSSSTTDAKPSPHVSPVAFPQWPLPKRTRLFLTREEPRNLCQPLLSVLIAICPARRTCCRNIRNYESVSSAPPTRSLPPPTI